MPHDHAPARQRRTASSDSDEEDALYRLWHALDQHLNHGAAVPERTARLAASGKRKMAQKLVEEAAEVALAATSENREEVIAESVDLLYHLTMIWAALGISPQDIWDECKAREALYGLAEKRTKKLL